MPSEPQDHPDSPTVFGLPVRMTVRTWDHGDGVVHRDEESAVCSRAPEKSPDRGDLETTTVRNDAVGGMRLCEQCEWPDGAREVFNSDE